MNGKEHQVCDLEAQGDANLYRVGRVAPIDKTEASTINNEARSCDLFDTEDREPFKKTLPLCSLIPLTVVLCATLFCVSLDGTIVATAIPKITSQFDSLKDVAWYGSSYLLSICSMQLIYGKLYTSYSSKWLFIMSLLIFEVGSLISGAAPTSIGLIIGRAVAGLGAAGISSGAMIIVTTTVPLRIRPVYMGLASSIHVVASVAGPIMGGVFTDYLTWRWCFYINLPFGGLAALLVLVLLPPDSKTATRLGWGEQLKQIDLPGLCISVPSIVCLVLALQWGGSSYAWNSGQVIALFTVFGVLFIGFLGIQKWQKDRAMVPLRIMKNRNIWGAAWYGSCISATMSIFAYYLPIWFQAVKGVTATQSGIDNLPSLVGTILFAIIGGVIASISGYYTPWVLLSSVLTPVGAGMLSTLEPDSTMGSWIGYQVLLSAGVGIGGQNSFLVTSTAVPPSDMAVAVTVLSFTQILAGAIFLPVGQSVFQNQLVKNLQSALPNVDALAIQSGGITGFRSYIPANQLPLALGAYNDAISHTFYVAIATSSLSIIGPIFMEWLSLKSTEQVEGGDGNMVESKHRHA